MTSAEEIAKELTLKVLSQTTIYVDTTPTKAFDAKNTGTAVVALFDTIFDGVKKSLEAK